MSQELKDLKEEAKELGIQFSVNIGAEKLKAKIAEHCAKLETEKTDDDKFNTLRQEAKELGVTILKSDDINSLSAKIEKAYKTSENSDPIIINTSTELSDAATSHLTPAEIKQIRVNKLAKKMEERARRTAVVTIVDNDQRVNNQTTTCSVECCNNYFDLGRITLPLNVPVEVSVGHIGVLKEIMIPQHILDQKTKLASVTTRRRYSVSYESLANPNDE